MINLTRSDVYAKTFKVLRRKVSAAFQVPTHQLPRIFFHAGILACIIAGFWLLDSLKDPILANTVGMQYQPIAKLLSVISTLFIVCIYDFLTSLVDKPSLFHIVSGIFGMIMMILSALLSNKDVGLSNTDIGPHRLIGWACYFTIEAYGSLMVALFWSFTNSIMDLEQAKGGYGLIISIAQIGAILGSTLATNAHTIGISQLFIISAMLIFSVSLLIKTYHLTFRDVFTEAVKERVRSISESTHADAPLQMAMTKARGGSLLSSSVDDMSDASSDIDFDPLLDDDDDDDDDSQTLLSSATGHKGAKVAVAAVEATFMQSVGKVFGGFYEGLSLVTRHTYIIKLLGVSCLYEVVVTVLDYQFKILGAQSVAQQPIDIHMGLSDQGDRFANLLGHFGQVTNLLSFVISFFGFSYFVHSLGVSRALLIFPVTLFAAVVIINLVPSLWVLFVFVSVLKALIFSLHDPVKELLYIPTSEAIKFKAKAWVDVFGSRFAKAAGSLITNLSHGDPNALRRSGEIPCLVLSALIIAVTWSIGKDFEELVKSETIVGDDRPGHSQQHTGDTPLLPVIHGKRPGDVGYSGYDPHLFDGVFPSDDEDDTDEGGGRFAVQQRTLRPGGGSVVDNNKLVQEQRTAMKQYQFPNVKHIGSASGSSSSCGGGGGGRPPSLELPNKGISTVAARAVGGDIDGGVSPNSRRLRAQSAQL